MPKNPDIKKVLVLGSGPIIIGQAAEFDYAGTQACRSRHLLKQQPEEMLSNMAIDSFAVKKNSHIVMYSRPPRAEAANAASREITRHTKPEGSGLLNS